MSFQPQFHIPGAFNFDTSGRLGQALHANVFRPPPSPSSSSYNLTKSTGSLFSDISMSNAQPIGMAKRKRASTRESTPMDWNMAMEGANDGREEKSREIRYTLAGQINATPATATVGPDNGLLDESVYSDVDYRRALGPNTAPEPESPSGQMVPDRTEGDRPNQIGWSLFSLRTLGDMVGKVWEFCKNGAFQGFHAGGGSGYNVNGSTVTQTTGNAWTPEVSTLAPPAEDSPMAEEVSMYLPPQSHTPYSPVYHDVSTPDSTPQPAAKRRQVSANNDELRNWVVVDEPNGQQPKRFASEVRAAAARPSGLVRPRSGYYSQTSASSHRRINAPSPRFTGGTPTLPRAATRPSLRVSNVGSPMLPPREPASFASPRSSPSSRSTPSRIPVAVQSPGPVSSNPNPFAIPGTTTVATTAAPLPPFTSALKSSASRPSSRQSARPSSRQSARPSSRQSHTSRHSLGTTTTTTRPISPTKSSGHRRSGSAITRRQSLLSPPRPVTVDTATAVDATQQQGSSPSRLDAEARQLAQRRIAAERDADMRVDAFNARLLSMIRQGREALGTKVEVEMDVSREGWEDDD